MSGHDVLVRSNLEFSDNRLVDSVFAEKFGALKLALTKVIYEEAGCDMHSSTGVRLIDVQRTN